MWHSVRYKFVDISVVFVSNTNGYNDVQGLNPYMYPDMG
jgi:hypothetical protein